jgi:hypothetical protein
MRYVEFREAIQKELIENPEGFTWAELKERLRLPYEEPCPTWVKRMEQEIGLVRARGAKRAYLWKIPPGIRS